MGATFWPRKSANCGRELPNDELVVDALRRREEPQELAAQARGAGALALVDDVERLTVGRDGEGARLLRLDVDAEQGQEQLPAAGHAEADGGAIGGDDRPRARLWNAHGDVEQRVLEMDQPIHAGPTVDHADVR